MFFYLIIFFSLLNFSSNAKLALVNQPVIDLLAAPAGSPAIYQNIALAPANKNLASCPRLHQALFNETVNILAETAHEAQIKIFNTYFIDHTTKQKNSTYWTLKKNLTPFINLDHNTNLIPAPIDYHKPNHFESNIATLKVPWYCKQTKQTYSAGTRFKIDPKTTLAYCYQSDTNRFIQIKIPKHYLISSKKRSTQKQRKLFIDLIQSWAQSSHHKNIPYTWGGCSMITKFSTNKFKLIQKDSLAYYQLPGDTAQPHAGLDCTGLVLRAAQAAGIPYFCKNSSTLAQALPCIANHEPIEPGDLIWLSGHVIIIANLAGDCFEARGYGDGYGKTQRIHISKLFKDIHDLTQIKTASLNHSPLTRINKKGASTGRYKIKLLKLLPSQN